MTEVATSAPTLPDLVGEAFDEPPHRPSSWGEGRVYGGYRALKRIAAGGMGIVFRAEHLASGDAVALKTLARAICADPTAGQRLLAEGEAARSCRHRNVVRVYDVGRSAEGEPFVAMELLAGATLSEELRVRGPLPVIRAVRIGRQILSALGAVHANGLVHRDVKTENFVLARGRTGKEQVKLLDFGIARARPGSTRARMPEFGERAIVGTPRFMSPEQALGDEVDGRTDLFSFGVVLYQMLTGSLPHATTSLRPAELTASLLTMPPIPLRERRAEVPERLASIVMRALAREPDERWPSAWAMRSALESWSRSYAAEVA